MRRLVLVFLILSLPLFSQNTASKPKGKTKIGMAQARQTALAKQAGTVKSAELEKEDGRLVYSFDIQTKEGIHEVQVDAYSGEVVSDKIETKEDEAKEKAAERKHHKGVKSSEDKH